VGRVRELSMLKQLLHSTAEDGRAHMVSVSGIGGIGKSRLTWEFEKYLDGLADSFLWHRGRCLSYGDGVAFWALAEIVRMRCRIVEDEGAESAAAKLEETLAEYLTADEAATVREPLRQLLGMSGEPDGDRNRLFPAWRLFIERMAETAPVVLVIEDIHWADNALLDFVEYLIEWSRHLPLFVLALSRPELAERRPSWGSAARALTSLTLEPLTGPEMLELVSGLAPGAPGELVERIAVGAEGVPLYAVETVRMLLDRGLLAREGERLVATADLTTLEIPETLHALVAARLDALPKAERRLIEDAAVLGKTFTLSGLAAVAGLPETELEPLVASLVRREVLVMQTDPRSPERGQYEFVQALVRTIAYETIGRRERKRRHKAAAEYLESLGGEELSEVIAAHYVDAYRLAPEDADAEQLRDYAKRGLLRAVERARSLAATGEAERLLRAAIDLTEDPAERAQLLEEAGQLTIADGRPGDAIGQFAEADELLRELGELHGAARLRARQAEALFLEGRTDESVALMEPAYSVLRDQEQDADLAALASQYARMLGFVDRLDESIEPLERAIEIAEQLRAWATLSHSLNTKGLVSLSKGRPQEGRTLLLGALRVAEEADDHPTALRAHFNLSYMAQWSDRLQGGDDQRGLELSRKIGDRNWERAFLMHQAADLFRSGDWDEALKVAEESAQEAADQFSLSAVLHPVATIQAWRGDAEAACLATERSGFQQDHPDRQARASWAWSVGMQRMAAGRWPEAAEATANWQETGEALGMQHPAVKACFVVWGEASLRAGDAASARAFVARVRALPAGQLTPYVEAHGHRIAALLGEGDDPAAELAMAVATLRRIGYRFDLMLTLADAAEVTPADAGWAAEARAEAVEIARELGAVSIIERLESTDVPSAAAGA
jgi:tetratricopeptide (TPR) repeat protein